MPPTAARPRLHARRNCGNSALTHVAPLCAVKDKKNTKPLIIKRLKFWFKTDADTFNSKDNESDSISLSQD
jgi:hypothetical protein